MIIGFFLLFLSLGVVLIGFLSKGTPFFSLVLIFYDIGEISMLIIVEFIFAKEGKSIQELIRKALDFIAQSIIGMIDYSSIDTVVFECFTDVILSNYSMLWVIIPKGQSYRGKICL